MDADMEIGLTASVYSFRTSNSDLFASRQRTLKPQPPDKVEWVSATLNTEGTLRVSTLANNEMLYIKVNNFTRAVMPRSTVWRISADEIVICASMSSYWLIKLHGNSDDINSLDKILIKSCKYHILDTDVNTENLIKITPEPDTPDHATRHAAHKLSVEHGTLKNKEKKETNTEEELKISKLKSTVTPQRVDIPPVTPAKERTSLTPINSNDLMHSSHSNDLLEPTNHRIDISETDVDSPCSSISSASTSPDANDYTFSKSVEATILDKADSWCYKPQEFCSTLYETQENYSLIPMHSSPITTIQPRPAFTEPLPDPHKDDVDILTAAFELNKDVFEPHYESAIDDNTVRSRSCVEYTECIDNSHILQKYGCIDLYDCVSINPNDADESLTQRILAHSSADFQISKEQSESMDISGTELIRKSLNADIDVSAVDVGCIKYWEPGLLHRETNDVTRLFLK